MFALDTNILVRYIMQDDKEQALQATKAIEGLTTDKQGFISSIVLCEVNWVLKSAYHIPKEQCIAALNKIISVAVFDIEHIECCLQALKAWQKGSADFSDYLIQSIAEAKGYAVTLSFDKKALKSKGFRLPC